MIILYFFGSKNFLSRQLFYEHFVLLYNDDTVSVLAAVRKIFYSDIARARLWRFYAGPNSARSLDKFGR